MSNNHRRRLNENSAGLHTLATVLLFILATLAASVPAGANDSPVISGSTATYSGNQQPNPISQNNSGIYTIYVQNLTTNVGSSSMGNAIYLTNTGKGGGKGDTGGRGADSQALLLDYTGGSYYLYGATRVIYVYTTGGNGGQGNANISSQNGGDGGAGGEGGLATVTDSGPITVSGSATGIQASSGGGAGGGGGDANGAFLNQYGGAGGVGGSGGTVSVTSYGPISGAGYGIFATSFGGNGGGAGDTGTAGKGQGGNAGAGGNGGVIDVTSNGAITTGSGDIPIGVDAISEGGDGATGGIGGGDKGLGGDGGAGGNGGTITIVNNGAISGAGGFIDTGLNAMSEGGAGGTGGAGKGTGGCAGGDGGRGGAGSGIVITNNANISSAISYGINGRSLGAAGGKGGALNSAGGSGGNGGAGGAGGNVAIASNPGTITTSGDLAPGIAAISAGGNGGVGAAANTFASGTGGNGGDGGTSGAIQADSYSVITTSGSQACGIYGLSQGGLGASGAQGGATDGTGGQGGAGGAGGAVTIYNHKGGSITTTGANADGIVAQSSGSDGGDGGAGKGVSGTAGNGGAGGAGKNVQVINDGTITISGTGADGISGQSSGGYGGDGAAGLGGDGSGGAGGNGGTAGSVAITSSGAISATGANSAIAVQSIGGNGGGGGTGGGAYGPGGAGGNGGSASAVMVNSSSVITANDSKTRGIYVKSTGGAGGNGGGGYGGGGNGGNAGGGGAGASVTITSSGAIFTGGAIGIDAESIGGAGGSGGSGYGASGIGGNAGAGGASGQVSVEAAANITTDGSHYAIEALSNGGKGGNGGNAGGANGKGGNAGAGGASAISGANIVSVKVDSGVSLTGGIMAESNGGGGAKGPTAYGVGAEGGNGSAGGNAGNVLVQSDGNITAIGVNGILAQSIGGPGGAGGDAGAAVALAGNGGTGGLSGAVNVTSSGFIRVTGNQIDGILAQSWGGSGGNGGNGYGAAGVQGNPGNSGIAGAVSVTLTGAGAITTGGDDSCGVLAQSVGGVGGGGGGGYGLISWGASAGPGANGGTVSVAAGSSTKNTGYIKTQGKGSTAILAQSIGGGGGDGGSSGSVFYNIGGSGVTGGDGGSASVVNYLQLTTIGDNGCGIEAQSLGGGGGNGGGSVSVANGIGVSMGGSGGPGGSGNAVVVNNYGAITTSGASAYGIFAQSLGGGGGDGGYAITAGAGDVEIAMGGSGGFGGSGGKVRVISASSINTSGSDAVGILAESIGGGGGAGGYAVSAGEGLVMVGIGGSGGSGGSASEVDVGSSSAYSSGDIATSGFNSQGILAQSVGGGGGDGGWSVSGGIGIPVSIGGSGSAGGAGGAVNVYNSGAIATTNDSSQGILAQSVGGGGGNGGFSLAGNITPILSASCALGGSGGPGSNGQAVTVQNTGSISTGSSAQSVLGSMSDGILAQSIGGGGGNGGWAGTGSLSFSVPDVPISASMALSLGGGGGSGGNGGAVTVNNLASATGISSISTIGDQAYGIFAQSVGGGGGNGGGAVAVTLNFEPTESFGLTCPVALGGTAGSGGSGDQVTVTNQNGITTLGEDSLGILAQSVGGGGGEGGWSVTTSLQISAKSANIDPSVSVGGAGGSGGVANTVAVTNTGAISTSGESATGIEAQSVGGGGGDGGWSFRADAMFGESTGLNPKVVVGGSGGGGGGGGAVSVANGQSGNAAFGEIATSGDQSIGILAQSIGGGGGNGGEAAFFSLEVEAGSAAGEEGKAGSLTFSPSVSVGGAGGKGNAGGQVTVTNYADISTSGIKSYGIEAQSVGGGGGDGGSVTSLELGANVTQEEAKNIEVPSSELTSPKDENGKLTPNVTVGGAGGDGNNGGVVTVNNSGAITTSGVDAYGVFAQSIGGGGGEGGSVEDFAIIEAVAKVLNHNPGESGFTHGDRISVGGSGGGASSGGGVTVNNSGAITTSGDAAYGIFAQSVGGGGGVGGTPAVGLTVPSGSWTDWKSWLLPTSGLSFQVGGNGGSSGDGGTVNVTNSGVIMTSGIAAYGIYAQSIGGGGGVASYDQSQMFSDTDNHGGEVEMDLLPGVISIGGTGGAAGAGGDVQVTNSGAITTLGDQACGIYAQSIGGGGGNASELGGPWMGIDWLQYFGLGVNVGRSGGGGGNGGAVTVADTSDIITRGYNANGIFAQSVGGAGGEGTVTTQLLQGYLWNGTFLSGAGGNGGVVTVSQTGNIYTYGTDSHGIVAQSVAGEDEGGNVTVTLNDPDSKATSGNIITSGLGSCGMVAQSLGVGGDGDITININQPATGSGVIQGGYTGTLVNSDGAVIDYNAYGVLILDGKNNTLTNHGTISTLDGATGTAVMVQADYGAPVWGNLTVNNYGTITGSINQGVQAASDMNEGLTLPSGKSTITINNYAGATYNAGPSMNLGDGTLTNSGLLALGATNSTLTGNYSQTSTGTLQTTITPSGAIGELSVSETAQLGGTLQVLDSSGIFTKSTSSTFLTGNIHGNFANIVLPASTPMLSFSVNGQNLVTRVNSYTTVAANLLQTDIGAHLDQLLAANTTGSIPDVLATFQRLGSSQYNTAFASLSPGIYGAETDTTFAITRQYVRILEQRMEDLRDDWAEGDPVRAKTMDDTAMPILAYNGADPSQVFGVNNSGWGNGRFGLWLEGFGQFGDQDSYNGFSGFNYGSGGTAMGFDYVFPKNLILGANFAYSYTKLDLNNGFSGGDIDSLYGSLYGSWFTERAYIDTIFSYGNHQYANTRQVSIGALQSTDYSNLNGNAFTFFAEGGYKFPMREWNVQPYASIIDSNLDEGAGTESGNAANMAVGSRSNNSLVSEFGVQVGRPIHTSKGILTPMVRAGWQHDYQVSNNNLPITFLGAPVGTTIVCPPAEQDSAEIKAGLTFQAKGNITTSLQYIGELGGRSRSNGVMGQIRISF